MLKKVPAAFCLFALALSLSRAFGADDERAPSGEKIWQLTDYLSGTAKQIGDRLNSDIIRLKGVCTENRVRVESNRSDVANDEKVATANLRKSHDYLQLKSELDVAQVAMLDARQHGSDADKLSTTTDYSRLRARLLKMEKSALDSDANLQASRARLMESQKYLDEARSSLEASIAWRRKLVDATRNTLAMKWPLYPDREGIIGKVEVLQIIDGDNLIGTYAASEVMDKDEKDKEGIIGTHVLVHPLTVRLEGISTKGLATGKTVQIDHSFVVRRSYFDGSSLAYHLLHKTDDADKLIEVLDKEP